MRSFSDRPAEDGPLNAVLEAGRLAPSARNMQDWRFIVVRDPALGRSLSEVARGPVQRGPGTGGWSSRAAAPRCLAPERACPGSSPTTAGEVPGAG
ncbi:MAG: hypothetical protein HPY61_01795 [Methanotrichaceae archaeon]|nr:hypothetical protein [Methanotrichaceae archaeon]